MRCSDGISIPLRDAFIGALEAFPANQDHHFHAEQEMMDAFAIVHTTLVQDSLHFFRLPGALSLGLPRSCLLGLSQFVTRGQETPDIGIHLMLQVLQIQKLFGGESPGDMSLTNPGAVNLQIQHWLPKVPALVSREKKSTQSFPQHQGHVLTALYIIQKVHETITNFNTSTFPL